MDTAIVREKAEYHRIAAEEMARSLGVPAWSPREKLALACRMLEEMQRAANILGQDFRVMAL